MNRMPAAAVAALFLAASTTLLAQIETPPPETESAWLARYEALVAKPPAPALGAHLKRLATAPEKARINAARVADAFPAAAFAPGFVAFNVPAMAETKRLPDTYPFDGNPGAPVRIVAARGEYEPGSFVIYSLASHGKVQFKVGDLKSDDGAVFPAKDLDLRTVKVWYQAGNAWISYFEDSGFILCPELLLHDEDLIKVDTEKVANYARLTDAKGKVRYSWLTPPRRVGWRFNNVQGISGAESFQAMRPEFRDAPAFAGATLDEGVFKQFLLTAHVGEETKPGLYKGAIALTKNGKPLGSIPVRLRVLPFTLPIPGTFRNPDKEFWVANSEYYIRHYDIRALNGNDAELADKQYLAIQRNLFEHGMRHPGNPEAIRRPAIAKAVGQELDHLRTIHDAKLADTAEMRYDARRLRRLFDRAFPGATEFYIGWGDEYGLKTLQSIRDMARIYRDLGFGFFINSRFTYAAGYDIADFFNPPMYPDSGNATAADKAALVNPGGRLGWYACQHTGVENPAFVRRQYGLGPWRAGFSCSYNYAHHLGNFNDIAGDTFRGMNFFYACYDGVLDTLAWEGCREAYDDLRYATLLQKLAKPLLTSTNRAAQAEARKAMRLVAEADGDNFDLDDFRLSMADAIMKMLPYAEDGQTKK